MAIKYVKSGAAGAADGSSWANAYTTLTTAAAAAAGGDTLYVSHLHSESQGSTMNVTFTNATPNNPVHVVCVNEAEPVVVQAETAVIATTGGSYSITINGSVYFYGVRLRAGVGVSSSTSNLNINLTDGHKQVYEKCLLEAAGVGTAGVVFGVTASGGTETATFLLNTNVKFNASGQKLRFNAAKVRWTGGVLEVGTVSPTNLVAFSSTQLVDAEFHGIDMSALSSSANMIDTGFASAGHITFANCKLPAPWSGELAGGAVVHPGFRAEMHNCDSADSSGRYKATDFAGSININPTLVKTRTDWEGVTPFSYKMDVTNANTKPYFTPLDSPAGYSFVPATGSAVTATVDILHDSVTNLTDADVWLEIQYLGTNGFPLSSFISDMKADFLASAANQDSSTATWTTTGMVNPNKQKLVIAFTPQETGFVQWRVMLAKPTTIYVDPKLQVA